MPLLIQRAPRWNPSAGFILMRSVCVHNAILFKLREPSLGFVLLALWCSIERQIWCCPAISPIGSRTDSLTGRKYSGHKRPVCGWWPHICNERSHFDCGLFGYAVAKGACDTDGLRHSDQSAESKFYNAIDGLLPCSVGNFLVENDKTELLHSLANRIRRNKGSDQQGFRFHWKGDQSL